MIEDFIQAAEQLRGSKPEALTPYVTQQGKQTLLRVGSVSDEDVFYLGYWDAEGVFHEFTPTPTPTDEYWKRFQDKVAMATMDLYSHFTPAL